MYNSFILYCLLLLLHITYARILNEIHVVRINIIYLIYN